jgi:hypothetical protein
VPINKVHKASERGRNAYFTPRVAVVALLEIEDDAIPENIYEPAVGAGSIARELERRGHTVHCADIHDYGYPGTIVEDYLVSDSCPPWVEGIITNPPFAHSKEFVEKACSQAAYVAMLGRIQYLESMKRMDWLVANPPTRMLIPSRRLPMMHREGWEGPRSSSNMCHPWFIWDKAFDQDGLTELIYYDWKDYEDGGTTTY